MQILSFYGHQCSNIVPYPMQTEYSASLAPTILKNDVGTSICIHNYICSEYQCKLWSYVAIRNEKGVSGTARTFHTFRQSLRPTYHTMEDLRAHSRPKHLLTQRRLIILCRRSKLFLDTVRDLAYLWTCISHLCGQRKWSPQVRKNLLLKSIGDDGKIWHELFSSTYLVSK